MRLDLSNIMDYSKRFSWKVDNSVIINMCTERQQKTDSRGSVRLTELEDENTKLKQ